MSTEESRQRVRDAFGFTTDSTPKGITLDDLMKSNLFLKAIPKTFSLTNPSQKPLTESQKFKTLLHFVEKHKDKTNLIQLLIPVFCTSYMNLKDKGDLEECQKFIEFMTKIPAGHRSVVERFVQNEKVYGNYACLFSTQNMMIEVTIEEAELIKQFLNEEQNSELRRQITSHVELIPKYEVKPHSNTEIKFSQNSTLKDISILQTVIPEATHAVVSNYTTDFYAAFLNAQVYRFNGKENLSQLITTHSSNVTSLSLSSTGSLLLSTDIEGNYNLWHETASAKGTLTMSSIWCSCFAPQGGVFAIGGDQCAYLYDASRNSKFRSFVGHQKALTSIQFHPNCALVGTTSADGTARIWDVRTGSSQRLFYDESSKQMKNRYSNIAFSPNGQLISYYNGKVCIANIGSNKEIASQPVGVGRVKSIQFAQDSKSVFVIGESGSIQLFSFNEDAIVKDVVNLNVNVIDAKLNPMNELFVLASHEL